MEIYLLPPKYWAITFIGWFLMQQKESVNIGKLEFSHKHCHFKLFHLNSI